MVYKEIETREELKTLLEQHNSIQRTVFQNIDFNEFSEKILNIPMTDCIFMGCRFNDKIQHHIEKGNYIFPVLDVPFNIYPETLYSRNTLYNNYKTGNPASFHDCYDQIIYRHYIEEGKEAHNIKETLARRLHDHSITDAMYDFLKSYNEKQVVAIMGGHNLSRTDKSFTDVARLSKLLTEQGWLMVSGGGTGAMEATHLGAWFAGKPHSQLDDAINMLSSAPSYKDELWLDMAFRVLDKYPGSNFESLGIPTWLYGHEPASPFATKIAKYFANSVREDGLLTIAKGGIIYSPGSAGTIQEIFQDVTQNHYLSFGYASPMIFLNSSYWTNHIPIYPLLSNLLSEGKLKNLILSIRDNIEDVKRELEKNCEL